MKKRFVFLALLPLGLIFFACEFNIPKAVEFRGNPTVKFRQTVPVGEKFTSILADAIKDNDDMKDMTIFLCEKTEIYTDLIHMNLFDEEFDLDDDNPEPPDFSGSELGDIFEDLKKDKIVTLDKDMILIQTKEPIEVPLKSIGNLLEGFEFHGHQIILYFDGTDIINNAKMNIYFNTVEDGEPVTIEYKDQDIPKGKSDFDDIWSKNDTYTDTNPPEGGLHVGLRLNGEDVTVSYEVYIPAGEEVKLADFKNCWIKGEVVIWLPFEFEAMEDEATISFPDDALFSSQDDLFGREKPGEDNIMTEIIQSMNVEIKFDINPFKESTLIAYSKNIEIKNELKNDDSFPFIVSKEDMDKVNDPENFPFTPNFKMKYLKGRILTLPSSFNVTEFIFNAKIKKRVDF